MGMKAVNKLKILPANRHPLISFPISQGWRGVIWGTDPSQQEVAGRATPPLRHLWEQKRWELNQLQKDLDVHYPSNAVPPGVR